MDPDSKTTVKPLLSGHLRVLPKCPLNRGCKNCAMFVNDQHSTVTFNVIKLRVVKDAIQSSSSLPFITYFNLSVNAKTLTDFSMYFKEVIQYYYNCQFSPVFLTIEISQIQLFLCVRLHLLEVSAE